LVKKGLIETLAKHQNFGQKIKILGKKILKSQLLVKNPNSGKS